MKLIKKILITGGGINGIAILGAVYEFLKNNDIKNIKEILGVSVGSIIGLLIILGYSIDEIKNIFIEIKLNKFMDYKIKRFIDHWGFDDGELNKKLLKAILINKNFNSNITFLELYKKTNIKFIVCGTNLTKQKTVYFNYINNPNMIIIDAIRISSSYPVVYTPIKYNSDFYVDGGILASFPIEYFKKKYKKIDDVLCFTISYLNNKDKIKEIKSIRIII